MSRAICQLIPVDKAHQLSSAQIFREMLHDEPKEIHCIHGLLRRLRLPLQLLQERHNVVL